jgi:hypothetical protein
LHGVPRAKGQVAAVDKTADQTVALAILFCHMAKIDTGLKYETVGSGLGKIVDKTGEITIRTEQHFFAGFVDGFPQLGIPWDDGLPVNLGVHKRPLCPDKVIVLNNDFNACLGPGFHVKQGSAKKAVEDFFHFSGIGRSHQKHFPPESLNGA